jgi:hypothetical protein
VVGEASSSAQKWQRKTTAKKGHEKILHDYFRRIARDKKLPSPNDTCQTFEKAMAMVKDAAFLHRGLRFKHREATSRNAQKGRAVVARPFQ